TVAWRGSDDGLEQVATESPGGGEGGAGGGGAGGGGAGGGGGMPEGDGGLPPFVQAATGDLDGDGDLEIVALPPVEGGLQASRIDARDGAFEATPIATAPMSTGGVALADVDGDGTVDLFLSGKDEPHRLLVGDGAGAFKPARAGALPHEEAPGARRPAAGDLD